MFYRPRFEQLMTSTAVDSLGTLYQNTCNFHRYSAVGTQNGINERRKIIITVDLDRIYKTTGETVSTGVAPTIVRDVTPHGHSKQPLKKQPR